MAVSTTKKVLIQRFDRETLAGYVNPQSYLSADGVELMTLNGSVVVTPYSEVKAVCFVREFEPPRSEPEKRFFQNRPKNQGLWIRLLFRDLEEMDGLLPNALLDCDPFGFTFTPPDPYSNTQRMFVPKAALSNLKVVAVIGSPLRQRRGGKKPPDERQLPMFQ